MSFDASRLAKMHIYKYGIIVHQRVKYNTQKWRVALFEGEVSGHGFIDVITDIFDFKPRPGCSVKAKFEDELSDQPSVVTLCTEYEWIRDVEVINSKVVIFLIAQLSAECLETPIQREGTNISYYIIQNDDTDFRRIAIPKSVVDKKMASKSALQKPDEPEMYRVGVCWDPCMFEGGVHVYWRSYNDFPIVPIFELYYRDTTLPYLSESMVYGVLEGLAIRKNESGVLFWTVGMGCAIMSNVTMDAEMPPLGCVNYVLAKRCLPEKSFDFPCFYELLPETRSRKWEGIKIVTDELKGSVYIEACCECILMDEGKEPMFAMKIPHLGKVYRGLESYRNLLFIGKKYYFRVEFQKERRSYVPVIVDLCLEQDEVVQCRVVHVSTDHYLAVLEPRGDTFERRKQNIDFIRIPSRVMFCAKGIHVEKEELLIYRYTVRVRFTSKPHDIVTAVHVEEVCELQKDPIYAIFNKTVWIRSIVKINEYRDGPIELICPRLQQLLTDYSRFSAEMPKTLQFAVQAQFVLSPENIPSFWVRNIAPSIHQLPRLTTQIVASLPTLENAFTALSVSDDTTQGNQSISSKNVESVSKISDSKAGTSTAVTSSIVKNDSVQTILNESETEHSQKGASSSRQSNQDSFVSSDNIIITESWLASTSGCSTSFSASRSVQGSEVPDNSKLCGDVITESLLASSASSAAAASQCSNVYGSDYPDNSRLHGDIITESVLASSRSSSVSCVNSAKNSPINVDKLSVAGSDQPRRTLFGYNVPGRNQGRGFGPSSYNRPRPSIRRHPATVVGSVRRRPIKYGFRELKVVSSHEEVLQDVVYRFRHNRLMFVNNERDAKESWFHTPNAKVTTTKKCVAFAIPIELIQCRLEMARKAPRFTYLVRFILLDKIMHVGDTSVVIPVGGIFPTMPKSFQLGERYKVEHFSFSPDRMCRFGGFAFALKNHFFYEEAPLDSMTNMRIMENKVGHEFLRFTINVVRPCIPEVKSEVFELWNSEQLPGYIIVEKSKDLMKLLDPMIPEDEESHAYSAVIEPLAGGPMDVSILRDTSKDKEFIDVFVYWRLVVEFSEDVPMPKLLNKRERYKEPHPPRKREVGSIPVQDYGMWETLHINSKLAQEKLDLLRSLNDPRVKMLDGPDLKPEIEIRKVDVDSRRKSMFEAMDKFFEKLSSLKDNGMFNFVFADDLRAKFKNLQSYDDDYHPHQFKKRSYSLEVGMNNITDLLLRGGGYRQMNEYEEFKPLLKTLAECVDLNATYVKKTDDVKKMLLFFRKQKIIRYI